MKEGISIVYSYRVFESLKQTASFRWDQTFRRRKVVNMLPVVVVVDTTVDSGAIVVAWGLSKVASRAIATIMPKRRAVSSDARTYEHEHGWPPRYLIQTNYWEKTTTKYRKHFFFFLFLDVSSNKSLEFAQNACVFDGWIESIKKQNKKSLPMSTFRPQKKFQPLLVKL